jgi:hypothetical protein
MVNMGITPKVITVQTNVLSKLNFPGVVPDSRLITLFRFISATTLIIVAATASSITQLVTRSVSRYGNGYSLTESISVIAATVVNSATLSRCGKVYNTSFALAVYSLTLIAELQLVLTDQ